MYTNTVNAPEMRCIVSKWNLDPCLCGVVVSMCARQMSTVSTTNAKGYNRIRMWSGVVTNNRSAGSITCGMRDKSTKSTF